MSTAGAPSQSLAKLLDGIATLPRDVAVMFSQGMLIGSTPKRRMIHAGERCRNRSSTAAWMLPPAPIAPIWKD